MRADRIAALRAERTTVLDYCNALTDAEWSAPSAASGWTVQDVVAHLGATARAPFTPELITLLRAKEIERTNDVGVAKRDDKTAAEALAEFETWSSWVIKAARPMLAPLIRRARFPIGELGTYPLGVFTSVYVYEWHLHLRHDIASALDRPVPPTDDNRMAAVVEWLLAGVEQMNKNEMRWLDAGVSLKLLGNGGGVWRIDPAGKGRLRVTEGEGPGTVAKIVAQAEEFPVWSTTRRPWRESEVTVTGDTEVGTRFLDALNIV